jgi:hypothetical protein
VTTSSTDQRLTDWPSPQGICPQSEGHLMDAGLPGLGAVVVVVVVAAVVVVIWAAAGVGARAPVAGIAGAAEAVGLGIVPPDMTGSLLGLGETLPGLRLSKVRGRFRATNPLPTDRVLPSVNLSRQAQHLPLTATHYRPTTYQHAHHLRIYCSERFERIRSSARGIGLPFDRFSFYPTRPSMTTSLPSSRAPHHECGHRTPNPLIVEIEIRLVMRKDFIDVPCPLLSRALFPVSI